MQIFLYISFSFAAVTAKPVAFTNYSELFGSNSSSFEAINIDAAPTNWKSDLGRFFFFCKYLSTKLTDMWKVYIKIFIPIA